MRIEAIPPKRGRKPDRFEFKSSPPLDDKPLMDPETQRMRVELDEIQRRMLNLGRSLSRIEKMKAHDRSDFFNPPSLTGLWKEAALAELRLAPLRMLSGLILVAPARYMTNMLDPAARSVEETIAFIGTIVLVSALLALNDIYSCTRRLVSTMESGASDELKSLMKAKASLEQRLSGKAEVL